MNDREMLELKKKQLEIVEMIAKSGDKELLKEYLRVSFLFNQGSVLEKILQDERMRKEVKDIINTLFTYIKEGETMKGGEWAIKCVKTMFSEDKTNVDLLGLKVATLKMSPKETLKGQFKLFGFSAILFFVLFWGIVFGIVFFLLFMDALFSGGIKINFEEKVFLIIMLTIFLPALLIFYGFKKAFKKEKKEERIEFFEKEREDLNKLKKGLENLQFQMKEVKGGVK